MHARAASVDQAPGNAAEVATAPGSATQRRAQEWNDAPEALGLLGRVQERALLWRWILEDRSREVLFEAGDRDGSYLEGYASYGTLLQVLGGSQHHSCLLLTSREAPPELPMLGTAHGAVRWLELGG